MKYTELEVELNKIERVRTNLALAADWLRESESSFAPEMLSVIRAQIRELNKQRDEIGREMDALPSPTLQAHYDKLANNP